MAKLYKTINAGASAADAAKHGRPAGSAGGHVRWYVTQQEAELAMAAEAATNPGGGASELIEVELDELELRQAAVNWLNRSETMRQAALKREANKSAEQRSNIMRKAWQKRKSK